MNLFASAFGHQLGKATQMFAEGNLKLAKHWLWKAEETIAELERLKDHRTVPFFRKWFRKLF